MKPSERMALVDKVGRELQARFTFGELRDYFAAAGVPLPEDASENSKWVCSRAALNPLPLARIIEIADDLGIAGRGHPAALSPPETWKQTMLFRLFVSHISADKDKATRLRDCLIQYGIAGFVAHEDINPTLGWQDQIERALFHMDAFLAIHTPGYSKSIWTQQEIGFALGRGVKVISFKMGEDPTGFISNKQALPRRNRTAEQIAEEIDKFLEADATTRERLRAAKVALLAA
jgi:hypothetical protein